MSHSCNRRLWRAETDNGRENPMKITWLGHSAFRIEIAQSTILIDPFLNGNPGARGVD
ncbi:MBL fold metallo-hydrolase, partial [Mycobacterium tuberculosis]|nr:MBL fold metallo-hydrolase [Mycobacterium tuberculosis]